MSLAWMFFIGSCGVTTVYWLFGYRYLKNKEKDGVNK